MGRFFYATASLTFDNTLQHAVDWHIKHFDQLTALEHHHILAIRTAVFVVEQDCPYQEVDHKDLHSYHVWGMVDNEIIAVIRIVEPGVSYSELSIGRVAVAMDYRGTNVGNDLMKVSLDYIEEKLGAQPIRISAQEHLQKFYHRFDFKTVSEIYLEDDIPHVEMLRDKRL